MKRGLKVILTVSRWHKDGLPGYSDVVVLSPSLSEVSRMAVAGPPTGCEELVNGCQWQRHLGISYRRPVLAPELHDERADPSLKRQKSTQRRTIRTST